MTKVEVLLEKMKGKQALAKHIALNKENTDFTELQEILQFY